MNMRSKSLPLKRSTPQSTRLDKLAPVPEPTFAQPERRSFLVPILVALAALALASGIAIHFYPATTVNIDHIHTDVVDTHTVFATKTIVIGPQKSQDVLYIVEDLRVDNQLRLNIFLDDFELTLTDADGAQLVVKAVQKTDLPTLRSSFPQLQPMLTTPLLRETSIEPGKAAQGAVVFSLPLPKATWDTRRSAVIKVDLYHQPSLYLTIPKA